MSRPSRARTAVPLTAALAGALLLVPPTTAAAAPPQRPQTIPLETRSMPEGIAAGRGTNFYAGARSDGTVYVGDVRTGEVDVLVEGDGTGPAVGMAYDERSGLLWVAGGNGGDVTAYDGRTGEQVFRTVVDGAGFLNDVAITRDAVYVTDSFGGELVVVELSRNGLPGDVDSLTLRGAFEPPAEGSFGPNGIRELPGGDLLLVSETVLYTVDPDTGSTEVVEVDGRELDGGDGLEVRGSTVYVVNGYGGDEVVVLRLRGGGDEARTLGVLTAGELDRPTTGALIGGSLYVVNGRFDTLRTDPDADVYITRLPAR